MKNQLIATLVGAVILFLWQFLSWGPLNLHGGETRYTPNQDAILEVLSQNLEEGEYFVPSAPTAEEREAMMPEMEGKPWATINYHPSMSTSMGGNLARGFIVDLVSVFLLVWLLGKFGDLTLGTAVMASLAIGFIGYMTLPYTRSIWFETNTWGNLIDTVVAWGIIGAWLGWYLTRKRAAA